MVQEQINRIISSKLKRDRRLVAVGVGLSGRDCGKLIKIPHIVYYSIINKEEILVVLNWSFNNPLPLLYIVFPKLCQEIYMKVSGRSHMCCRTTVNWLLQFVKKYQIRRGII